MSNDELSLYDIYVLLKKRLLVMACTAALCFALVGAVTYATRPVYRHSVIIKIPSLSIDAQRRPIITKVELKRIIDELDYSVKNAKNRKALSDKFKLDDTELDVLSNFSVASSKEESNEYLGIYVDVYGQKFNKGILNGLIRYLNDDPYIRKKAEYYQKRGLLKKTEIEASLKSTESVKNKIILLIKSEGPKNIYLDPLQLEREFIDFKLAMLDIENDIKSLGGFEIASEGVIVEKVRPKIILNLAVAFILSLILGVFISFFIEWYMKNVRKT